MNNETLKEIRKQSPFAKMCKWLQACDSEDAAKNPSPERNRLHDDRLDLQSTF